MVMRKGGFGLHGYRILKLTKRQSLRFTGGISINNLGSDVTYDNGNGNESVIDIISNFLIIIGELIVGGLQINYFIRTIVLRS